MARPSSLMHGRLRAADPPVHATDPRLRGSAKSARANQCTDATSALATRAVVCEGHPKDEGPYGDRGILRPQRAKRLAPTEHSLRRFQPHPGLLARLTDRSFNQATIGWIEAPARERHLARPGVVGRLGPLYRQELAETQGRVRLPEWRTQHQRDGGVASGPVLPSRVRSAMCRRERSSYRG